MSKSRETFSKREKEKKRLQHRQEKREKMLQRKANEKKGKSLDEMLAYLDENGNVTTTPADTNLRKLFVEDNVSVSLSGQTRP